MRALTDKAIQFRTFPVMPRRRVMFDANVPVILTSFESKDPVFKLMGGYFTRHSYNLLDYFVSRWADIATAKWKQQFGTNYPINPFNEDVERLCKMSPMLRFKPEETAKLNDHLIELCRQMQDYAVIPELSDIEMRRHCSLEGLSSQALFEIIDRTSKARLKTEYSLRVIRSEKKKLFLGYQSIFNLGDHQPWSNLFDYRVINERQGQDGRVVERVYKFVFNGMLGIAMIHNTICGGHWTINPKFYEVSADAQLLYRYLVIAGSRTKNHRVDYIGHRIGLREKQKTRLATCITNLFEELKAAGLIVNFEVHNGSRRRTLFSFEGWRRKEAGKKGEGQDDAQSKVLSS
jgi:hypothetical protein